MANVKSDIDVNAFPPVDEVCSNSDVAAAQKNGYEEFPWSDMGLIAAIHCRHTSQNQ